MIGQRNFFGFEFLLLLRKPTVSAKASEYITDIYELLYITIFTCVYTIYRYITNLLISNQLPDGLHDSSLGRALHRYRRDHGFKPEFFSGFNFTTTYVVCITAVINQLFICFWQYYFKCQYPSFLNTSLKILLAEYHCTFLRIQSTDVCGSARIHFMVPTLISVKLPLMTIWSLKEATKSAIEDPLQTNIAYLLFQKQ